MAESTERSSLVESRSKGKRGAIMDAATTVFLQKGYRGSSVDEIASLAGVSKQTVYKHFDDKERLFTEIVLGTIDQVGEPFYEAILLLQETDDLVGDLRELGSSSCNDRDAATAAAAPSARHRGGRTIPRARTRVLRARSGTDYRHAGVRLRAPREARAPAHRRRVDRGKPVPLVGRVDPVERGDALRGGRPLQRVGAGVLRR